MLGLGLLFAPVMQIVGRRAMTFDDLSDHREAQIKDAAQLRRASHESCIISIKSTLYFLELSGPCERVDGHRSYRINFQVNTSLRTLFF
jgi:hypothetical protein